MQGSWEPDFFVADWKVRPALGRLERGETSVSVESRSMQVLVCLARHAPDVVSRQRLMREVWGEAFVTDEVMSHAVWELRKAFGDEVKSPRYIQTLARRGYRLVAEVSRGVAPEPLAPGSRIGQYEILEPVAGGAMGEVYKAKDLRLGRVVALKFLPADLCREPSARKRFLREAQAVAQLDHPNVATIYETGETDGGRVFLALAFYEGETLQQKLEGGPLQIDEAVKIACQVARGLAAAHRRQIVHRDIKPANVVVCPDGTVKILDFGLAKMAGATTLTRLGSSPGTPAYKSPEQTRGEKVDPRSDLWALGVVLYEMVTGRIPFGGEYEQAVIYSILNEEPRPLEGKVSAGLAAVIDRALAKDAAARYQTAEEMEKDLGDLSLGPTAEVPIPRPRPRGWTASRSRWIVGGLAALLAIGVALWYGKAPRWDFSPEVARLMEQADRQEWRGDTKRILDNAESTYRKALLLAPENPLIKSQLAALLCRLESQFPEPSRRQEIRRLVEDAVTRAPDEPMPWAAQARLLLLENKPKEAESAARKAVELGPDFDRGYTMLGEALMAQKGRQDEGLRELQHGVEVGQGYLRARLAFAYRLKSSSRLDEAAVEYRKVLAYDPDHPTAKHNLAAIYLESGRYLDALRLFREVYEQTNDPRSANSLGLVYIYLDRMPEAIKTLGEAYRLEPDPTTARNLAECYEKVGQKEEARRWYEIALRSFDERLSLGGSRAPLLYSRSFCVAKLGRYDEALRNIQEAMAAMPNQSSFLFRLAQIHAMAGHREEVYAYLRRAVDEGYSREDLRNDWVLQPYRDDPRFRAILESTAVR